MIRLLADSSCDLSAELCEKYDVTILPMSISLDEKVFTDGADITPEQLYQWSDANKRTPKTSVFSVNSAKSVFASLLADGSEVIGFSISEKMSGSFEIMQIAIEELGAKERVHLIDSANLSTGVGLLILEAADRIAAGMRAEQIAGEMEALKPMVRTSFVVDTLTYLHRGGRCSGATALMGTALRLHPEIVVENGQMHPAKKYRGGMNRVLKHYTLDKLPALQEAAHRRVFITHSGCNLDQVDMVYSQIRDLQHFDEILVTQAGSVISSHCGPNTLGILYLEE